MNSGSFHWWTAGSAICTKTAGSSVGNRGEVWQSRSVSPAEVWNFRAIPRMSGLPSGQTEVPAPLDQRTRTGVARPVEVLGPAQGRRLGRWR